MRIYSYLDLIQFADRYGITPDQAQMICSLTSTVQKAVQFARPPASIKKARKNLVEKVTPLGFSVQFNDYPILFKNGSRVQLPT